MKMINGVLTAKKEEIPLILDAITFMEESFMRSTSDKGNIQKALDDPKARQQMDNSIRKFKDLNHLVNSFTDEWSKECHFTPLFEKDFRDFIDRISVEEFFDMLVNKILKA